jgi:hypothetical protein
MKVCEICRDEIATKDGENRCLKCQKASTGKKKLFRKNAETRDAIMESLGLVKVRGAMGGVYFE